MSSEHVLGQTDSVDAQTDEQTAVEGPELRPTVELESQAKVDTNHPDARPEGMTLAAEERFEAREQEIAATRLRLDDRQDSDREARTRRVAVEGSRQRRYEFQKRAASVDPKLDSDRGDPRAELEPEMLGAVNREAARVAETVQGRSRAALARRLAERVADGDGLMSAVVGVVEETETARGTIVPIGKLDEMYREEVSVEGIVDTLWDPSHPSISQVGLLADETGRTKFTSWVKSRAPVVEEGERVRIRGAKLSRYNGRCSIAVTGWTQITFPDRG